MKVTLHDLYNHCNSSHRIHKEFDFSKWNHGIVLNGSPIPNCLTAGCLAGELPALDPDWEFLTNAGNTTGIYYKYHALHPFDSLAKYFKISPTAARHLFQPDSQKPYWYGGRHLHGNSSLEEVLDNLESYLNRSLRQRFLSWVYDHIVPEYYK